MAMSKRIQEYVCMYAVSLDEDFWIFMTSCSQPEAPTYGWVHILSTPGSLRRPGIV